jgi:hypothetical protein
MYRLVSLFDTKNVCEKSKRDRVVSCEHFLDCVQLRKAIDIVSDGSRNCERYQFPQSYTATSFHSQIALPRSQSAEHVVASCVFPRNELALYLLRFGDDFVAKRGPCPLSGTAVTELQ